ncbi:MAG: ABC transporter permease [SAR324 cluster bacterium]|nr:ABC transporter permease [SAR324 cluster bacterium]
MKPLAAVFRVQARYWLRHKLQVVLCFSGIVLGVAVFCAIQLANRGALDAFAEGVDAIAGKATHRVYAPAGGGLSESLFPRLALAEPVRAAAPLLRDRIVTQGAERLPLTVLGIDPVSDAAFREVAFLAGRGDTAAADAVRQLERFLADPAAVLLPAALAERLALGPGDAFDVETSAGSQRFRVSGVFQPPAHRRHAFSRTVIVDVATHQERFGKVGRLDAINLIVKPGGERGLAALLPPGVTLERTGRRAERIAHMSRAFRLNLEALGLFALLVAMFLIYNAATFSVVQRESTIAMLRCIGSATRTIFAALLLEAVLLGTIGGVAGVLLGRWLGAVMLRNTGATLFEVVLNVEAMPATVALDARIWTVGLALAIGVSIAGALQPAWAGARVSPLAAVRISRMPDPRRFPLARWVLVGSGALAVAAALTLVPGSSLLAGLIGATALALGGALLCPPAVVLVSRLATPVLGALFGAAGRMAGRNLGRALSRTGMAAASLMLALSLALAIEITVRSFKRTFEIWLDQVVTADLYLHSAVLEDDTPLPGGLLQALRRFPFVRDVAVLRSRRVVLGDREVLVLAVDLPAYARNSNLPTRDGSKEEVFARLAAGEIFVSEPLAFPLALRRGDVLTLPTPQGERDFVIGAVVQNYSAPQGVIYMERRQFEDVFGAPPPRRAALWLRPGTSLEHALRAIESLPQAGRLHVTPNAELRDNALRVFDRSFAITDLMGALAALVAFIAVVSALTALLEERLRTLGFLRAIGVSRGVLGASMALEAALLALTAALVSWPTGLLTAMVLIFVVNRRAFGWTLQFLPQEGSYGWLLGLALGAALLGSLYPIYRATRLSIVATIREE